MKKEDTTTRPEKTCYSTEELQFFKELILKKIEEAKHNLQLLQESIAGNENEAMDTAPTFKTVERCTRHQSNNIHLTKYSLTISTPAWFKWSSSK